MKKQNKHLKIVVIAVLLMLVLLLGYTFAKYTKSYTIPTSSTVAKWSFAGEVFNSKNSSTTTTISLADTIENSKIKGERIAPGTNGDFTIVVDATGTEVDLDYKVELVEETNKPQNLKFSYNGTVYNSLSELIGAEEVFEGKISHSDENMKKEIFVEWEWPYETYNEQGVLLDEVDMQDGENIDNYEFTLKINGTQSI